MTTEPSLQKIVKRFLHGHAKDRVRKVDVQTRSRKIVNFRRIK
jgi:hypothetical protein